MFVQLWCFLCETAPSRGLCGTERALTTPSYTS